MQFALIRKQNSLAREFQRNLQLTNLLNIKNSANILTILPGVGFENHFIRVTDN